MAVSIMRTLKTLFNLPENAWLAFSFFVSLYQQIKTINNEKDTHYFELCYYSFGWHCNNFILHYSYKAFNTHCNNVKLKQ